MNTRELPDAAQAESTSNWSGVFVQASDGNTFRSIEGAWTVPDAFLPPEAVDGAWYLVSTWIGLTSTDGSIALRVGCDSVTRTSNGAIQSQSRPWWQLASAGTAPIPPAPPVPIGNLPVVPGDTVDCHILLGPDSATAATILIVNVPNGTTASLRATAPQEVSLAGDVTEWAVGTSDFISYGPVELARFSDIYIAEASAWTAANAVLNARAGDIVDLADDASGNVIARARIETPTLIQVRYTGA